MDKRYYKLNVDFPTMANIAGLDAEEFRCVVIALIDHSLGFSKHALTGNAKRMFEAICETEDRQHQEAFEEYSRRYRQSRKKRHETLQTSLMKTTSQTESAESPESPDSPESPESPDSVGGEEKENEKGGEKEKSTKRERDPERVREREFVPGVCGNKQFENKNDPPGITTALAGGMHTSTDPEAQNARQEENTPGHSADTLAGPVAANPPSTEEVRAYCESRGWSMDVNEFMDYNQSKQWMLGNTPIRDWKACLSLWHRRAKEQADSAGYEAADSPYRTWKFYDELEY